MIIDYSKITYLLGNENFSKNITKKQNSIINKLIQSNTHFINNKGNLINDKISYH